MKTALIAVALCMGVRAQTLLSEDFASGVLDPARWQAVTQGVPLGGTAVFVQGGECVLQNRGHLVTVQEFSHAAVGGYAVQCQWRCTDANDVFALLVRSDGVPSGAYGAPSNGVGLDIWLGGTQTLVVRGALLQIGAQTTSGPGLTFLPGVTYTSTVTDMGFKIVVRTVGADPTTDWIVTEADILLDATTTQRIVFHNREQTAGFHQALIDNISVATILPVASLGQFGGSCQGPFATTPVLMPVSGGLPRIGSSFRIRAGSLPMLVTVPIFIVGFSASQAAGPLGPYPLPFDLAALGWPGCQQLVSLDITTLAITTSGFADHTIDVPAFPILAGAEFFAQAMVLYSPAGVAVTNGLHGVIGY